MTVHTGARLRRLRFLLLFMVAAAAGGGTLGALDRIIIDPILQSDASPETLDRLEAALPRAAAWLNRTYGSDIEVAAAPPEGSAAVQADYRLQLIVSGSGADESMVLSMKRAGKEAEPLSFPILSRFGSAPELELAEIIYYEYRSFNGLPKAAGAAPDLVATVTPSMLSSADMPFPVELRPMSVAALPGSHLVVGTTLAAVELDPYFREVAKPGIEIYRDRNTPYAYQVAASPAGTLLTYGTGGGEVYLLRPGQTQPLVLRTGFDMPPASTILNDGSVVLVDSVRHRAIRIAGRSQQQIDIFPGPHSYVTSIAAGPDDTLWVWDPVEGRAHIYTSGGEKIGSLIPLLDTAARRSIKLIRVLADGTLLLLGSNDLWKTDRFGAPMWHLSGLPLPEQGGFTYVNSIDVDGPKSLIYLANQVGGKVYVLCDTADAASRGSKDSFRDGLVSLNRRLAKHPDDLAALRGRAELAESAGSYALAATEWQAVLDAAPGDGEASRGLDRTEVAVLGSRAHQAAARALSLLDQLGPESARVSYQTAVQLYEKAIARSVADAGLKRELERLKQRFQESTAPSKRPSPVEVISTRLPPLFPALIRYYQNHAVWSVTLRNRGDTPVRSVRVALSMRYFDYPVTSDPLPLLAPGQQATIDLRLTLSPEVLTLQEDLPLQVSYQVSFDSGGAEGSGTGNGQALSVTGTASSTLHRNSALTWDDTGKFAAFITPNDQVISDFALTAADPAGLFPDWQLSKRLLRAAKIVDTLGAMGMRYVEDPTSPISRVLGSTEMIDTVRFPRTTIRLRSGDCDDTTALLASCLEAAGIPTAIMTSPGHVFLAFDTGEPSSYAWMYRSGELTALSREGTVWIPLESTVMSDGFAASWRSASELVADQRSSRALEFLPTAEEQEVYPPIPLAAAPVDVAPPTSEQVAELFSGTTAALIEGLYDENAKSLKRESRTEGDARAAASTLNRLGILSARFGRTGEAIASFREAIRRASGYYPAYVNLCQAQLLDGRLEQAERTLGEAAAIRADDPLLLVLRSRLASLKGESGTAKELLAEAERRDPATAAYGDATATSGRAGGRGASAAGERTAIWLSPDQ